MSKAGSEFRLSVLQREHASTRLARPLKSVQRLLGKAKNDVIDRCAVCLGGTHHRNVERGTDPSRRGGSAELTSRDQDSRLGLRRLAQLVAVERPHLSPVDLEHAMCEIGDWHTQGVSGVPRKVLDAMVDERRERRELVRRRAQARLQDCDHALTQQQGIERLVRHRHLSVPPCTTASNRVSRREGTALGKPLVQESSKTVPRYSWQRGGPTRNHREELVMTYGEAVAVHEAAHAAAMRERQVPLQRPAEFPCGNVPTCPVCVKAQAA